MHTTNKRAQKDGSLKSVSKTMGAAIALSLGLSGTAQAVNCGDVIGPNETVVLGQDLLACDDTAPTALTVIGPAMLDLNGYRVGCEDVDGNGAVPDGIALVGKKATVWNGQVENCREGVVVAGEGKHRVEEVTTTLNTRNGFHVASDGSRLYRNDADTNELNGFRVDGDKNDLRDNAATTTLRFNGFNVSGDKNKLRLNRAIANDAKGYNIGGDKNKLDQNIASHNDSEGFTVSGNKNTLRKNLATENGYHGYQLQGDKNKLIDNQALDNGRAGIRVQNGYEKNLIMKNTASGNDTKGGEPDSDLEDLNPDCGSTRWRDNDFNTSNQACIE